MKNDWLYPMDSDSLYPDSLFFNVDPFIVHNFINSNTIFSFLENSRSFGNDAFCCVSKFAGAFLLLFTGASVSNLAQDIAGSNNGYGGIRMGNGGGAGVATTGSSVRVKNVPSVGNDDGFGFRFRSKRKRNFSSASLGKVSSLTMDLIWREAKRFQSFPVLSLAAALVPPLQNLSSNVLAGPWQDPDVPMHGGTEQVAKEVERQGCPRLLFHELNLAKAAVEPKTGIEFPMILENALAGAQSAGFNSEVLVGTGSKNMTIVRIKSLKLYAFGFYVHPYSLCEKLGSKYASISTDELNNRQDIYQDLLREDITMTVRLVINCRGMKINSVRDAFEKSLRARLVKTNPSTDFNCITAFGSHFTQDIPLPLGTVVEFRRTVDGRLITEIGGNQIGSVHSKELCRAFFDMYLGDFPVCEQTKDEIGRNIANIIRKC
ncbi:fatty-acid-binding protein 2 [Arachis stenosperma]|uniref:fatty-acid-binding protein 2 n=1 Tax=Arachis stenosperma TaxID=217475 RepID=UPI0025AD5464|nr:fatty-acid-binding protein 2 [Arachis stenosperma]